MSTSLSLVPLPAVEPAPKMSPAEAAARARPIPGPNGARAFRQNTRPDHIQIVDD